MRRPFKRPQSFRSGLEETVSEDLTQRGVPFTYEKAAVEYQPLLKTRKYTPDFWLENGVVIETKGYFPNQDRQKMLAVKASNPGLDLRILFQRASTPINKGSKTTYGAWADKNGFTWAEKRVPDDWLN